MTRVLRSGWRPAIAGSRTTVVLLVCALLFPAFAAAQTSWESSPYEIHVLLARSGSLPSGQAGPTALAEAIAQRASVVAGPCWNLRVQEPPAALSCKILHDIEALSIEELAGSLLAADKLMLLAVSPSSGAWSIVVRELDCRTRQWGPVVRQRVAQRSQVPEAAFRTLVEVFAPLARIVRVEDEEVMLSVRGAALDHANHFGMMLSRGDLSRPILRYTDRKGNLQTDGIQEIPWTYLEVNKISGGTYQCAIHSGLRAPLGARRRGNVERLALAVRTAARGTTLRLRSRARPEQALVGYEVVDRTGGDEAEVLLGLTDHRGELHLEPADHPLRMLYIKRGGQYLARLPVVPGFRGMVVATVSSDDMRLAVAGYLVGVRNDLLDMVARREVLLAHIRACIEDGDLSQARQLLTTLQRLPTQDEFARRIDRIERMVVTSDRAEQAVIGRLLEDARAMVNEHWNPVLIDRIERELQEARSK